MTAPEPTDRHVPRCAIRMSDADCDCGADDLVVDMPLLHPDTGSLADQLERIDRGRTS